MTSPAVCPLCHGEKTVPQRVGDALARRACPTCDGTGVVWKPLSGAEDTPQAHIDLTFEPE